MSSDLPSPGPITITKSDLMYAQRRYAFCCSKRELENSLVYWKKCWCQDMTGFYKICSLKISLISLIITFAYIPLYSISIFTKLHWKYFTSVKLKNVFCSLRIGILLFRIDELVHTILRYNISILVPFVFRMI